MRLDTGVSKKVLIISVFDLHSKRRNESACGCGDGNEKS